MCDVAVIVIGIAGVLGAIAVIAVPDKFVDQLRARGIGERDAERLSRPLALALMVIFGLVALGSAWAAEGICR